MAQRVRRNQAGKRRRVLKHEGVTEEYQEKAALYALDALSQSEARAFEDHVRQGCPVCESELRSFEFVTGAIGLAAPSANPPDFLRDLLTARVAREAQAQASVVPFPERASLVAAGASRDYPQQTSRPARRRNYLAWAVAASLAMFALASVLVWRQAREARSLGEDLANVRAEVEGLRAQIDEEKRTASELAQINAVLSSTGSRVIDLKGLDAAPSASAKVYWDVQNNRWVVASDLPPPPAGKVYQLWFVTAEAKISAGLIKSDQKGHGLTLVSLPKGVERLAAAAITLEPEGGSAQPTMPIYALGAVG